MIRSTYQAHFDAEPEARAEAPGRVNLIGEHTDYNGGFVLPMAIPQRTSVEIGRRSGSIVRVVTDGMAKKTAAFEIGRETRVGDWIDYVQGTVWALRRSGFPVPGFDAAISSQVPVGSGLSSSAALEVSLLRALRSAFSLTIEDVAIAQIGRWAENDFVGAPVGIMDQMASSLADDRTALFLDTRSLSFSRIALPEGAEVMVIDSGVTHSHANGDYRTRRAECEQAAALLGVGELRDVGEPAVLEKLPPVLARRARHVVTENARVLEAVSCMQRGDAEGVGRLFHDSHVSLRDDFQVSVPDVDRLVELARQTEHVFGARMTGGGFGGAIVALVKKGQAAEIASRVVASYNAGGAPQGRVLVPMTAN